MIDSFKERWFRGLREGVSLIVRVSVRHGCLLYFKGLWEGVSLSGFAGEQVACAER